MKKQQTLHVFLTILANLGCYQYFEHKDRKLIVVFQCRPHVTAAYCTIGSSLRKKLLQALNLLHVSLAASMN